MKEILIVKLSAIGDVIHALPVSYAIKEQFPKAHITWVVEPPAKPLLELNPCVDAILAFHKKEFRSLGGFLSHFAPFRRAIQARRYDAVLDLQGLLKSAAIAYLADAPVKRGMCNMREGSSLVSKPVLGAHAHGHIVARYLDVARAIGCAVREVRFPLEIPAKVEQQARQIFYQAGGNMGNAYVCLAVGANWPNKRWNAESFAALVDWLYARRRRPVLVGGGAVDAQMAAEIEAQADIPPVSLVGRTTLPQLACVLSHAAAVVGGDTGPMHLATALGTKTVMLMGPTDANRNGPYGQAEGAIEAARPCRGCWKRACPKGLDCLAAITPGQVEEKLL
ncbi:glycosyltransferase family 9 protein [Mitsuokella sp. oral taxon 131]|uniref:glycosyltransferase family 9 protein n=1 Tax=Mitsuokella sp. oral taxon 131 TaxID=1321780 RepID=UPI0003ADE5D1|nr:glycosyltransferase family 9 protein [Mitsuokella sp. oral taxon 131]ERL04116.1 putative lipopolysaccharide heptosyltransferase I [Mitsuokella sp. oral taxon 131 str. W9106]